MIDSVWEDMNDDGHVMFSWLPDSLLTQCGKTGVATAKSKPFVTRLDSAPLRDKVLQVLSGFWSHKKEIKGDNSCKRLNCLVSAHLALIASSIYASCPFAARYFCALLLSMPTTAGCAVDLYQRTILFCAFVILILFLCCQVLLGPQKDFLSRTFLWRAVSVMMRFLWCGLAVLLL